MGRNPIGNALWKPDATNTSRNPWHRLRCERAWPEFNIWIGTRVSDPDPLCAKIPHTRGATRVARRMRHQKREDSGERSATAAKWAVGYSSAEMMPERVARSVRIKFDTQNRQGSPSRLTALKMAIDLSAPAGR